MVQYIANLFDLQISYNGAVKHMSSSTKAEIMTILTALIVAHEHATVKIYTDSQAAIDSFSKSSQLRHISPRRFNKINYTSLCATIHHIINELRLSVQLIEVKAHSNDANNDKADQLAKGGHFNNTSTSINHNHVPSQTVTLL